MDNVEDMADEAINFFQSQFHEDRVPSNFSIFNHVPAMVEMVHNDELIKQATKDEVKKAFVGLNGDRSGGPDGFHGCFYQTC